MQKNIFVKCPVCGDICDLKYQIGNSKEYPIRYKCNCGVTIKGNYIDGRITMKNAKLVEEQLPQFVVMISGEFLTRVPYSVTSMEEIRTGLTAFIEATQHIDYFEYQKSLEKLINYRDYRSAQVNALNELYNYGNEIKVKELIDRIFNSEKLLFPLSNEADYLRAMTMINQLQFLGYDEHTSRVTSLFLKTVKMYPKECNSYFDFIKSINRLDKWKKRIVNICRSIYEKIDYIMPVVSIDYAYNQEEYLNGNYTLTTTSFEEIKTLYQDLYELITDMLILLYGFDNINQRKDYKEINIVKGINAKTLDDVLKMKNKGNIIKLIDFDAPFESELKDFLRNDIRNGIGHFDYDSEELSTGKGQIVRFYKLNDPLTFVDVSLVDICYDIWCMYKSLGIFNELIHQIELQILANDKGIFPSFITDKRTYNKMVQQKSIKKIRVNDPCPCGSGKKYKKCCRNKKW